MSQQNEGYENLMQVWAGLWQTGFSAVWHGYSQMMGAMQAYTLGQSQVGRTPAREVWRAGRVRLLRYVPTVTEIQPRPLLIVPSLINRYYILDLMPERSLVTHLVSQGLDVYMLDWGRPTAADRELTLDEHITGYLHRAVRQVRRTSHYDAPINLLGYCMGGMFAAVYAALFPQQVAGLVNLAGPINYHDDGIFSLFTRAEWFDADRLVETYGNIPADLLCWTFQMIRPTSHLLRALYVYERMEDPDYVRSFAAMQTWIFDQVDFPGEAFRKYVKALYQENQLVNDRFTIDGTRVLLSDITCPTLTIASEHDETAPCGSVRILHERISSEDNELLLLKGPHVGMVAGSKAPKYLWPPLTQWLQKRSC